VTGVLPLAAMIRDDKLYQLGSLLVRGRAFGMIRLDDSLAELVRAKRITEEVAMRFADSKKDLEIAIRGKPVEAAAPAAKKGFGLFGKKDKD
jgi:twitching motility protein PilT